MTGSSFPPEESARGVLRQRLRLRYFGNTPAPLTERNQSAPCDTESIRVGSQALEERYVHIGHVVSIASVVSVVKVGDLAGNSTHVVPDRGASTVRVMSSFDLVGG